MNTTEEPYDENEAEEDILLAAIAPCSICRKDTLIDASKTDTIICSECEKEKQKELEAAHEKVKTELSKTKNVR